MATVVPVDTPTIVTSDLEKEVNIQIYLIINFIFLIGGIVAIILGQIYNSLGLFIVGILLSVLAIIMLIVRVSDIYVSCMTKCLLWFIVLPEETPRNNQTHVGNMV